ncbi:hypothetical protein [Brevibacillus brevis]|uniref:Uncharacterized protein n=1 Tax=Brevibacillus brevis TaxID=1393 RepID=A0ABY9SZE7_BREBE|nr:hypothetical protein [Brevibacillus brevis]WNC13186.1 hypothetical protein RGB73_21050 [Brevibacillus brevis]
MKRPTYTLPSIVKKVFRSGERSLPRTEVRSRMEANDLNAFLNLDSETLLDKVLSMEQSPVRVGSSDAIVELTYQPHQLFDLAHRFLRETLTPKKMDQIVAELRRQTQFGWNQIQRLLQLEKDPRFVQYQGDPRWFLAEWKVGNDQVYAFCRDNGITQVTSRSLVHFLEQEVGMAADTAFLPLLDDRFRIDGERLYIIVRSDDEPKEEESAELEVAVAAAPDTIAITDEEQEEASPSDDTVQLLDQHQEPMIIKEEQIMNTVSNQQVLQEVSQLLLQALSRLEARQQEMSQEVVAHFQQSNMQAIEVLMNEKHKHEQIALGIKQVLAASEQQ